MEPEKKTKDRIKQTLAAAGSRARAALRAVRRAAGTALMWGSGFIGGVLAYNAGQELWTGAALETARKELIARHEDMIADCFEKSASPAADIDRAACEGQRIMSGFDVIDLQNRGLDGKLNLVAGGLLAAFAVPALGTSYAIHRRRKKQNAPEQKKAKP